MMQEWEDNLDESVAEYSLAMTMVRPLPPCTAV